MQDTARVLDDLLNEENQKSWEQLERVKDIPSCYLCVASYIPIVLDITSN